MKITLDDLMNCPSGKSLEEYLREKAKIKRQQKRLSKLIDQRYDLEDALDVLEDEAGSERWKRKKAELESVNRKIDELWKKMSS